MYRRTTALIVALYALAFALAAMAAIRWPSFMMAVDFFTEAGQSPDWRKIGVFYAGPYVLGSILMFASSVQIQTRRNGAFLLFVLGLASAFPSARLAHFEENWWIAPSIPDAAGAATLALTGLLAWAVLDLRKRRGRPQPQPAPRPALDPADPRLPAILFGQDARYDPSRPPAPRQPRPAWTQDGPVVPAAIARQRAMFAAEGRKAMARRWR